MRFLGYGSAIILQVCTWSASGQTPDDRYVRVYSLIEDADKSNSSGEARTAINKYLEAQVAIKDLQRLYPNWNERIVSYRLDYISGKLEPLTRSTALQRAEIVGKGTTVGAPVPPRQAQQQEIAELAAQNAFLEAKLREALRVQPATSDPRELARAEDRIKALQKERDLLAITLEQIRQKQHPNPSRSANTEAMQQQLVTQNAVADVLRKQNDELQSRIAELHHRVHGGAESEKLSLQEALAALQASNRVMKAEQIAMESRLLDWVKSFNTGNKARENDWEMQLIEARTTAAAALKERNELVHKLQGLTKQLNQTANSPSTPATDELEKQLESIQARLAVFEAKQVPYTEEELALFKQAPIKIAAAQTNVPPASVHRKTGELPPGAGPLMREVERAIDSGRFAEAEQKLRDLLRQDEAHPFVLAKLAAVQMDQDKTADAEASLKRALEANPEDPVSLYLLGSVRIRQENYDDAVGLLTQAVKFVPENAQAHYFLGKALIQQGQRGPAETELRKAIQLRPGWGDAHYLLAVIYATQEPKIQELGQYHYKKAIAGGAARNPDLERWMEKKPSMPRP
jgi:tetratricopeptide (TPR) repeat protein